MQTRQSAQGVFAQHAGESVPAFEQRMNTLATREYAQLADVHVTRRYGWQDSQFVCTADVDHAPVIKTGRRSRRGGQKQRARAAAYAGT